MTTPHPAELTEAERVRLRELAEGAWWRGYAEGKEEAETRDLSFDELTDRAERAERGVDYGLPHVYIDTDDRKQVQRLADLFAVANDPRATCASEHAISSVRDALREFACATCGGPTASVDDGVVVCVSGSRLPHPPAETRAIPSGTGDTDA